MQEIKNDFKIPLEDERENEIEEENATKSITFRYLHYENALLKLDTA